VVIATLASVDAMIRFDEPMPARLIADLQSRKSSWRVAIGRSSRWWAWMNVGYAVVLLEPRRCVTRSPEPATCTRPGSARSA